MPTHNSAAKTQGELFSTSTYMMIQRKTLSTVGKLPKWEKSSLKRTIKLSKMDTKQQLIDSKIHQNLYEK